MNFFDFSVTDNFSDKSYAAKLLSYHPNLNPKLNEKNSIITTKIVNSVNFVPLAEANDFTTPETTPANPEDPGTDNANEQNFYTDVLVQPNPDTLSSLIAKQIKVYKTVAGDTLSSIAKQNGISVETIMGANNLNSEKIRPGWYLVILPTDGVLHKATSNDTLPDIAKKYSGNLETIISYNGLENAEDIDKDQLIIVPGGKIPEALKPKPTPRPNSGKVNTGGIAKPNFVNNGTGHLFPWGYCTWYVASKVHVPWGGNAKNWLTNAKAYGAVVSDQAAPGAIVVTTDNRRYGHVALVEKVEDDKILVSEMNYQAFGKINTRWIPLGSKIIRGYIYP